MNGEWLTWTAVLVSGLVGVLVALGAGLVGRWYARPRPRWMLAGTRNDQGRRASWRVINSGDGTAFRVRVRVVDTIWWRPVGRSNEAASWPVLDGAVMAVCEPGQAWRPDVETGDGYWMVNTRVDDTSKVVVTWDESPTNRRRRRGCEQELVIVEEVIDITSRSKRSGGTS